METPHLRVGYPRCSMPRIVVTRTLPGGRHSLPDDAWIWPEPRPMPSEVMARALADAEGALVMLTDRIDAELLVGAPRLRVLSQMAVGVDNIDLSACTARRLPVGHTPGVLTETTADTAWALLSAAVRRIPEGDRVVAGGGWGVWHPEFMLGGDLAGTTLGIVGLGRIGQAVARRAAGFSMNVIYTGPGRKPYLEAALRIGYRTFPALLAESDHVILCAPLTPDTQGMIDAEALAMMKPTATLVNVARGPLVDHAALADALERGVIGRAALDVTDPEPFPRDHRLVGMDNCLIVPHLGSASVRTRRAMAALAVENLVAGINGRRLPYCVNPDVYLD